MGVCGQQVHDHVRRSALCRLYGRDRESGMAHGEDGMAWGENWRPGESPMRGWDEEWDGP